jgi:hypothetical protein
MARTTSESLPAALISSAHNTRPSLVARVQASNASRTLLDEPQF